MSDVGAGLLLRDSAATRRIEAVRALGNGHKRAVRVLRRFGDEDQDVRLRAQEAQDFEAHERW